MQKNHILVLTFSLITLLSGCQYFTFPGVHKIDVQQGNIITQDMIDQLKPGMTRTQVRFVLGNPIIEDTFSPDRWDYFYSLLDSDNNYAQKRLTIFFDGDVMTSFEGDFVPTGALP